MNQSVRPSSPGTHTTNDPDSTSDVVLRIKNLTKHFGGAVAVQDVSLELSRGEAHALVGANGAGKSTIIRTLAGLVQPDSGEIEIDGRGVEFRNPTEPILHGLAFMHQELNLVPQFTAFENIVLGLPPGRVAGLATWRLYREQVNALVSELGMQIELDKLASELTVSAQWLVAMCRALVRNAHIIAMDEPTAALSAHEVDALLAVCRRLKSRGVAIIYVSHRLEEIESLCEAATVFRDGRVVDRIRSPQITKSRMIKGIAGREVTEMGIPPRTTPASAEIVLRVRNMSRPPEVNDVSLDLYRGEVLGIAGLVGSGRTELARMIVGVDVASVGEVELDGTRLKISSPVAARRAGLGLVPEERRSQALVLEESIELNMTLGWPAKVTNSRGSFLQSPRKITRVCTEWATAVSLKSSTLRQAVSGLSGGNQQKVAIARVLGQNGEVVILDEPSRGVDVGARSQIHQLIREAANDGKGIIVISSDLEELVGCDRVLVMSRGRMVSEFDGAKVTADLLLAAAFEASEETTIEGNDREQ